MHMPDIWKAIREHSLIVTVTAVLFAGVAAVLCLLAAPGYRATATIFVSMPFGNTAGELSQGSMYTQSQMESYAELAQTPAVLDPVIKELGLDTTAKRLASDVSAEVSGSSVLMTISGTSGSASGAADLANAVARQLAVAVQDLSPKSATGTPTVEMTTIGQAVPPTFAATPRTTLNVLIGLLAGLLVGISAAILKERLDTRVNRTGDIAKITRLPLLAEVPTFEADQAAPAEEFRRLRTNIGFLASDHRPLVLAITSSVAREGKSTTAANLARACARAGDRVLLVDADLRKPCLADRFGLEGAAGLTTVLTARASFADVVQQTNGDAPIDVLTSGVIPPNPTELLGSRAMKQLVADVSRMYDVIIFDTAPLVPVVDAAVLGRVLTGAVLVTRLGVARREHVQKALSSLEQAGSPALGVIVTGAEATAEPHYGYAPQTLES